MQELVKALNVFQGKLKQPKANRKGHRGNAYADLAAVVEAIQKPMLEAGLAFTQSVKAGADGLFLTTEVYSISSEKKFQSTIPLSTGLKPQELASELTYYKRYLLCSMLGVVADNDDDGEAAQEAKPQERRPYDNAVPKKNLSKLVTPNQLKRLHAISKERNYPTDIVKEVIAVLSKKISSKELNMGEYDSVVTFIEGTEVDLAPSRLIELQSEDFNVEGQ